jgi:sarcosine oxidase
MGRSYEVVVVGLGVMGAAITRELAMRGMRVLAVDRYRPPHALGSSHGETRIIREAYFEHPLYVPLVRRAFEAWSDVERAAGETLFRRTGALTLGPADGRLIGGTRDSAITHAIDHEVLSAADARQRFPHLDPPDSCVGILENRAGVLLAERCVEALTRLAADAGAEIRFDEPLLSWRRSGSGLTFRTRSEERPCGRLILAAGPWTPALLAANGLALPSRMEVERQVVAFFGGERYAGADGPVVLWEYEPDRFFYTLPDSNGGVKAGLHHDGEPFDPETADRSVRVDDLERIRTLLRRLSPEQRGDVRESAVCLYTNMPDGHFLIDAHTDEPNVIVASVCSGHGFKFAPALAPLVADLTLHHPTGPEAEPFRWRGRRNHA